MALTSRNTLGGPCRPKHLGDPSNQDFRDFNFLGDCFWYNLKIEKSRELEVLRPGRQSLITITIIITSSSPCSSKLHSSSYHEQASTSNQHQHQQMIDCHLLDLKSLSSSSVLRLWMQPIERALNWGSAESSDNWLLSSKIYQKYTRVRTVWFNSKIVMVCYK